MIKRAALLLALAFPAGLQAASYLPLPDADLVRRSPVIVDADVVGETHLTAQRRGEAGLPYSLVPLRVREALKGEAPTEILLRLPGGIAPNGYRSLIYGTPTFEAGSRVVLFLAPLAEPGQYTLTEFALSKFDVLEDGVGQLFAVRSTFQAGEDFYLSADVGGRAEPDAVRELPSLLSAVRAAYGSSVPEVRRGRPVGTLRPATEGRDGRNPLWVNIGGREGAGNLFRWFWSTGVSLDATVTISGTQSNLTDASNGTTHVQNAITQWASIPSTNVRVSGPVAGGTVLINLDVDSVSGGWTTPMDCSYGTVGLGGPGSSPGPFTYNGDSPYYAPSSGNVWMRRSTCTSPGYDSAIFRSAVMHELGHVLCLGHPDLKQSTHSTTTSGDWNVAVMRSSVPSARPSTPQTDDIQGMQYLYPGAGGCSYSINPTSNSVAALGSSGTVAVTTTAGCAWTATSNAAFITITSGASGTGSGAVQYGVSTNTGTARSGTVTIAGQTFTVTQAGVTCTYVLGASSASHSATGTTGSVTVTTPAGCAWTATSNAAFLTITSGAAGTGSGAVQYGVSTNTGTARSGTLTIAGQTFTVNQSGATSCTYSLGATSASYSVAASSGSVTVTTTAGCAWSANSNAAFLTITSGSSGNGSGTVGYSVGANTGTARSGTLNIAGQTFTVTQSGTSGGACVVNTTNLCLQANRFRVTVAWLNPYDGGSTGVGTAVPLTGDTGTYWFFSPSNYELMLKILDGRSTNGKFWVFYGALSDVQYTITITDTQTGAVKTYFNPGRTLGSVADVNALSGP